MLREAGGDFVSLGLNRLHGALINWERPGLEVPLGGGSTGKTGQEHRRETDKKTDRCGEEADDATDPFAPREGDDPVTEQRQNETGKNQKRGQTGARRVKP